MNTQPTHTIEPIEARLRHLEGRTYAKIGACKLDGAIVWDSAVADEAIGLARRVLAENARLRSERTEALNIIATIEQANLLAAKRVGMELSADTPNALAEEILKLRSEREAALAFVNEAEAIFDGELGEWADHYGRAFDLLSNIRSPHPTERINKTINMNSKQELVALLTVWGRSLLEAKIPFVIAVDFQDGSGDESFWSCMYGGRSEREKMLGDLAGISADMSDAERTQKGTDNGKD